MRQLLTLTLSDLSQRVRDKSVLIFALVVPLALMSVFNLVFSGSEDLELQPVTVAISVPAGDEMAAVVPEVVRGLDGDVIDVTVEEVDAATARTRVKDKEADVALILPDGFGAAAQRGEAVTVEALREESGLEVDVVLSAVDGVLDQFGSAAVTARAGLASGVPAEEIAGLAEQASQGGPPYELEEGKASDEQLDVGAALVAGQAGLFLLFTVSFGVTSLLLERETGTLARLRSMPMPAWIIVGSKALVSFVLGAVSTAVLLIVGGQLFDADFGSPLAVGVLVLCAAAAGTSVMFLIVRVARTSEQAGIASSIVAVVLGIGGGAFFPVSASGPVSTLLDLNPVAALLRGLGITSGGGGVADIGVPILLLLAFVAVMTLLSRLVPDRGALG